MSLAKDMTDRIINLMQFARKAGKLTGGTDACLRALHGRGLYLLVIAGDTAERTTKKLVNATEESGRRIKIIRLGTKVGISTALGLPFTGVFGILDKQFAAKMLEYYAAQQ
ncbi:MAG: ribosomal L7Ae/L30e/S12e/Gadd45 family protein [Candidatus Syntrophosphaera sp.]